MTLTSDGIITVRRIEKQVGKGSMGKMEMEMNGTSCTSCSCSSLEQLGFLGTAVEVRKKMVDVLSSKKYPFFFSFS